MWSATAAVVALNLAVLMTSTHRLAHSSWLATLLLGGILALVAPKRHLPLVQALIRGGLLTLPTFFVLAFIFTDLML